MKLHNVESILTFCCVAMFCHLQGDTDHLVTVLVRKATVESERRGDFDIEDIRGHLVERQKRVDEQVEEAQPVTAQ